MLDLTRCIFNRVLEKPVATGKSVEVEGAVVVSVLENGVEKVKLAPGAASTEKIAGFSFSHIKVATEAAYVEEATIPDSSPYTVSLKKNNLTPTQIMVYIDDTALTEATEATSSTEFVCDDATGILTFDSSNKGKTIKAVYRYYPTADEVKREYYDPNVNIDSSGSVYGQVGVAEGPGEVYTDQYDASVDWNNVTSIKVKAKGILTDSGSGPVLNGRIIKVPSINDPYLGIRF